MTIQETINYINNSTLERENYKIRGLFHNNETFKGILCFVDESYALKFETCNVNVCKYSETYTTWILLNRDTRVGIPLTEVEFFIYLDMFIEMDLLRQNRINIRRKIISLYIKDLVRDKKLDNII